MNSKLKIAVCISGDLRFFDISNLIYQLWIDNYPDIEFNFYVTAWNNDFKLEKYNLIKDYKILENFNSKHEDNKLSNSTSKYSFSMFKCHQLRRQSKINYDYVIQTRSDIVINKKTLDYILDTLKKGLPNNCIMVPGLTNIDRGKNLHLCDDNYSIGNTLSMNKFSMMYYDAFINQEYPGKTGFHEIQIEQARFRKLSIHSFESLKKYIRTKQTNEKEFEYEKIRHDSTIVFDWIKKT